MEPGMIDNGEAGVVLSEVRDDEPLAFKALRVRPMMSKKRAREWRAWCEWAAKLPPPSKVIEPSTDWRIVRV